MLSEMAIVALTLFSALVAAVAQYLFKQHMPRFNANANELFLLAKNRMIMLGLLIYIFSLGVYLYALGSGQLSFVYPTFASVFVFVLLISKFKLHEQISMRRAIGVALVMIGIIMVVITY